MSVSVASTDTSTTNNASVLNALKSSLSASKSELTEEEKKYDIDNDGTLNETEKVAMQESQAQAKALEASKASFSAEAASVDISKEGLKMLKQMPPGSPPDVNKMSDDELKEMLNGMKNRAGELPKELRSYNETDIDDLTEEDLSSIRKTMTEMQDKMQARMKEQAGSTAQTNEQRLINIAIAEYKKFSTEVV